MRVGVAGLWHLGAVSAACLASGGHQVVGVDPDPNLVRGLAGGTPAVAEPGLDALIAAGLASGNLIFSEDYGAVAGCDVVLIAFDTPVDEQDRADVEYVFDQIGKLAAHADRGALVLISSQLPVGSTARLEAQHAGRGLSFAYSPENLRLGKAIDVFTKPDRIVAGARTEADRRRIAELFQPFSSNIEWMSVESAELSKHALNAFLATSVCFINEIAAIAESVGADAREVERALKSDGRIGSKSYLGPGPAFSGGTLARDIVFLEGLGDHYERAIPLIRAVHASNDSHKLWVQRTVAGAVGAMTNARIAVLGLTYKPGTDTLRRSVSVETCRWLGDQGASVFAYDPAVRSLPRELNGAIHLCAAAEEALRGADAAVIATAWPEFQELPPELFVREMKTAVVVDAARHLERGLRSEPRIRYYGIGMGRHATRG